MNFKVADWLCGALSALYVATLMVVATGYQGSLRQVLASEVTAAWVGALGTIAAVVSGFWLARVQARTQTQNTLAAERRAIAARLRAATMLAAMSSSVIVRLVGRILESDDPRAAMRSAQRAKSIDLVIEQLEKIDLVGIVVPPAIDAIFSARGRLLILKEQISKWAELEGPLNEDERRQFERQRAMSRAYAKTLAQLTKHYDPDWETPPDMVTENLAEAKSVTP